MGEKTLDTGAQAWRTPAAKPENEQTRPGTEKILTVMVAAYNGEDTLPQALESCRIPGADKLEVLVVDDGSTDGTARQAEAYTARWPDTFRLIRQPNGGYGSALMTGLAHARGAYFRTLDCDDWFDPRALQQLVEYLERCTTDIVFTDYCTVRGQTVQQVFSVCRNRIPGQPCPCDALEAGQLDLEIHAMTCRTRFLRQAGLRLPGHCRYTDMAFTFIGMTAAQTVSFLPVTLYHYRLGRDGQSVSLESYRNHFEEYARVTELILNLADNLPDTGKGRLLRGRARDIAQYGIELLLRFPPSAEVKRQLKTYDTALRTRHPAIARLMTNKNTRLLRFSRYGLYRIAQRHARKKADR